MMPGLYRSAAATAPAPSVLSPTTTKPEWLSISMRSPSRTSSWSSTRRILISWFSLIRSMIRGGCWILERNLDAHDGRGSRGELDAHSSAEGLRALGDRPRPELQLRLLDAVVLDPKRQHAVVA